MMNTIVDLDSYTCSSNPIEAIEYLLNRKILFKISVYNPYFEEIKSKYNINTIKRDGDIIYFTISSDG